MAYGAVDRQTWNDERFRSWDRDVRNVWLYLLTSPHGNRLGCFVLSPYYVADDVQISPDRARECLEFLDRERRIVWDGENRVVCIVRHLHPDYNPLANQNVVKAAVKELKALPSSERALGALFWAVEKWGRPHYEELSQALENRLPNRSQQIREAVEEPFPEFTRVTPDPDPDPDQEPERRDGGSLPDGRSPPGEPAEENTQKQDRSSLAGTLRSDAQLGRSGGAVEANMTKSLDIADELHDAGYSYADQEDAVQGARLMIQNREDAFRGWIGPGETFGMGIFRHAKEQGVKLIETCKTYWYKHGVEPSENGLEATA